MMDRVRVGIVGAQFAASLHAEAYHRCPYAQVVAAASLDNLESFCKTWQVPDGYEDYKEMFARQDIDLVSLCVPNYLHKEIGVAALEAGKHLISEKPLATTLDDARAMIDAAEEAQRLLMYAEDWLFAPALLRAKAIIKEGALGDILYVKAKECHPGSHSVYARTRKYCGGGAMIHLAIHPIGFARWLKEKEVLEVTGFTSVGGENNLLHKEYEGEDWSVGMLRFEDGAFALVEGNYVTLGGLDDQVEIYGSQGNMRINLSQGSPITVFSMPGYSYAIEKAETTRGWTRPAVDEEGALGYIAEIAHYVNCVRGEEKLGWGEGGIDGYKALEIALAVYESASSSRPVELKG